MAFATWLQLVASPHSKPQRVQDLVSSVKQHSIPSEHLPPQSVINLLHWIAISN